MTELQRWAVKLEFDGRPFIGWQRQARGLSVQSVIETAASRITGGRAVPSITAGRTDAGVHARGLVAHLDFPKALKLSEYTIVNALNFHMKPHPVVILRAALVPPEWNARFSARWRAYEYRIINRQVRPTLEEGFAWHVCKPLDAEAMHLAAQELVGRHDFTSFRASACQARNPVRTLDFLEVTSKGEHVIISTRARAFLHHQVRNMVGTLKLVGEGKKTAQDIRQILEARSRQKAGPTAPACGLFFKAVGYLDDPFL